MSNKFNTGKGTFGTEFEAKINMTPKALETLSKWASVMRTLKNANEQLINSLSDNMSEEQREEILHCAKELEDITYPLDCLHTQVRDKLWQIQNDNKEKK